jgi:hypothetical protein
MSVLVAAIWGLAGGFASAVVSFAALVAGNNYGWPFRGNRDGPWPYLAVYLCGVVVGGIATAAAHDQMTGAWPALMVGVGAPAIIRGALTRVEVEVVTRTEPEIQTGARSEPAPSIDMAPSANVARSGAAAAAERASESAKKRTL